MTTPRYKRGFLFNFIKEFKKQPCLWDPDNDHYHHRSAREQALLVLLKTWQEHEPITLSGLRNKIQSLRSMWRRQRKKVESSAAASIPYKPTLWYYKHMNFLSGKDKSEDENDDNSDSDNNEENGYLQPVHSKKVAVPPAITMEVAPEASVEASALAFGRSVGAQLHQMTKMQRCVAEKLISDVIYHAKMDQLTMAAYVCVNENPGLPTIEVRPLIPKSGPSWYDTPIDTNDGEGSSSSTCQPVSDLQREMDETESAVNFIKLERNDSENYVFQDDLDEQRAVAVDVVIKEEVP